ncbi:hypothetical protein GCM10010470_49360 [Saccharopolyspora taberi]|uniref:Uncharacterized protein n=1 Tax=Saccharopolyspora taberi TaxID=60895 RepID=A0ABN3VIF5_9PSEU
MFTRRFPSCRNSPAKGEAPAGSGLPGRTSADRARGAAARLPLSSDARMEHARLSLRTVFSVTYDTFSDSRVADARKTNCTVPSIVTHFLDHEAPGSTAE